MNNIKADEGSCLFTMNKSSLKMGKYMDTLYKNTSAHTLIEEKVTFNKV